MMPGGTYPPLTRSTAIARWYRPVALGLTLALIAWIVFVMVASVPNPSFGLDYRWHMDAARRLLEVGTPYWPWQLSGPYAVANGAILYPPTAFLLFIPFLWLPAVLWWVVPISVTVFAMRRHAASPWAWLVTASLFALDKSLNVYVFGNPSMWVVAGIAAGTVWGWPAALVIAKPTFAPLALIGTPRRSWWVAMAGLLLLSLPFGALWFDWIAVLANAHVTLAYNLPTLPLILAPLVPWLAARSRR